MSSKDDKIANRHHIEEPFWEVFTASFPKFVTMLAEESERGSVIVGAAIMDDALQQLLQSRLVSSPEKDDELFIGPYAPLGGFSAKIDFAYRVGAIGLKLRSSLHVVRKIRNEFAHTSAQISFESQSVHSRIHELFSFNRELLDTIWDVVEKDGSGPVQEIGDKYKSQRGVDYLVKISGWRATFEILISIIAAILLARRTEIKTIEFDAEQTAIDQPSQ